MKPRSRLLLGLALFALIALPACSHTKDSAASLAVRQSSIAPPPTIAPDDKTKTVAAYREVAEAAQAAIPKSLTKTSGPQRLITATRALAACKSEPARAYARSLIALLMTYKIDAGPLPPTGTTTITYAELATVEALSQALMRGPESEHQGPAPAGPNTIPFSLHLQMLVLISRDAPSDGAATAAAFNTTNPLPADVSIDSRLSAGETQQLCLNAWANLRAHFTDPSRSVNLTCAGLVSSSSTFAYALFYAGNALAATPQLSLTGQEVQDLARGYSRMAKAVKALDPTFTLEEPSSGMHPDGLRKFARIIDDNIAITRAARGDITRFFSALAANDDATVKALSSNSKRQTAAQWRDYFGFDRPDPAKSLEVLGLGVTESAGCISITLKKSDTAGKVETDQQYVTVRKQGKHWLIIEG